MRSLLLILPLWISLILAPPAILAQDTPGGHMQAGSFNTYQPSWAVSVKVNTFGPGLEIVKGLGNRFSARLGGNYFTYNYESLYENINISADGDFKVGALSLLVDWYYAEILHLTTGVFYNLSRQSISAMPTEGFQVGSIYVSPEDIGDITINLEPNRFGPYFGLGFGRTISYDRLVSFNMELGVLYQGEPSVELEASGMIAPTANEQNEQVIEDNLSDFYLYPVITMQLSFKIF
ncbi:MAG: hypothetical protein K9G67_14605 [Bacteroidales bacterium]|nr:hypothetical protein [Bacteroidales bacterium]MCF8344614.1 hypothetical protein [Bacteroidales bacterium]MCF8351282.1 hypothetical protein [Bacteroidales bacterium]MCF8377583.1 hypothetical protein [Bacteroidales bacterium]MCF8401836.1 hypothetical protein [Bacteroidales bacterium]